MHKHVPRIRKQKARRRIEEASSRNGLDSQDASAAEKQALRNNLVPVGTKLSSKKARRLDKYIESKLRKEETRKLLSKLSKTKIDTSSLQSTKSVGTQRERPPQRETDFSSESGESEIDSSSEAERETQSVAKTSANPQVPTLVKEPLKEPVKASGASLKRPLEFDASGLPVLPVLKKRKRPAIPQRVEHVPSSASEDEDDEDSASEPSDESSAEDSEEESESSTSGDEERRTKALAFKSWAVQARNESLGYKPAAVAEISRPQVPPLARTDRDRESPLPDELKVSSKGAERKAYHVSVDRTEEIQEARMKLPVLAEEQKIMEAINNNPVVILCGATGSGKTTQIPQFLYETGYGSPGSPNPGLIGVTQPRRVAAVSMSRRVGEELGDTGKKVSYQIRFESTMSRDTAIKFMTDGVLLREIGEDILLRRYSAIVIDEAHERSINTDILIGMMSRILRLREQMSKEDPTVKPLKLIIMSATLRVTDFSENRLLFNPAPPILDVEGVQHPVTTHFARRTTALYLDEMFRKITKGHKKLPPGGFLVFLTSQSDIKYLSQKLAQALGSKYRKPAVDVKISGSEAPLEVEDFEVGVDEDQEDFDDLMNDQGSSSDEDSDEEFHMDVVDHSGHKQLDPHILPLYSLLPTKEQMKVFEPPPPGSRLIVLSTNIAETSLTIPGISYVFDSGRAKKRKFKRETGIQSFEIDWISKASAQQRAGRAGRTGPGHCYRLYSSAVYERDFEAFEEPEVMLAPIEGTVLQLKSMKLDNIVNFPFPTPPSKGSLSQSETLLSVLGALDAERKITALGGAMSMFPLPPRFSKILCVGNQHDCLPYVIAIISALSVGEIFLTEHDLNIKGRDNNDAEDEKTRHDDEGAEKRKALRRAHAQFSRLDETNDAIRLLAAICAYEYGQDSPTSSAEHFASTNYLRLKALQDVHKLREQLSSIVSTSSPGVLGKQPGSGKGGVFSAKLPPPNSTQLKALRQILAAGFLDNVAIRADLHPSPPSSLRYSRKKATATSVPYLPLKPLPRLNESNQAGDDELDPAVYIHASSVLAQRASGTGAESLPPYIIYTHLQQTSKPVSTKDTTTNVAATKTRTRTRMFPLTPLTAKELLAVTGGSSLLRYGKPLLSVEPIKELDASGSRRECWVVPYLGGGISAGGFGWPLPAKKVVQRKGKRGVWITE